MSANFNFNKAIIGGRLTSTPELKKTPSGVSVTSFSVAVNRRFKGENGEAQTDFISVTAWRQQAEFVCQFFSKGSSICIVGSIQTSSFTDKNGEKRFKTEVVADEVNFVDAKGENEGKCTPTNENAAQSENGAVGAMPIVPQFETLADGEELPF